MLAMLGWMGWVAYQLTPHSVVTPAAYAAVTQARAARNYQEGTITPAPAPQVPKKAPVDVEKLRLSDSIETPLRPISSPAPQK